jgi:hypothetical protein
MIVINPNMDECRDLWFPEGTTVVYVSRPWSEEFFENVILPFAEIGVTFKLLEQGEDTAEPSHSPELLPTAIAVRMLAHCRE